MGKSWEYNHKYLCVLLIYYWPPGDLSSIIIVIVLIASCPYLYPYLVQVHLPQHWRPAPYAKEKERRRRRRAATSAEDDDDHQENPGGSELIDSMMQTTTPLKNIGNTIKILEAVYNFKYKDYY